MVGPHTRKVGSGDGSGIRQDFPLCLPQVMQLRRSRFTMLLPLITQNCDLNSASFSGSIVKNSGMSTTNIEGSKIMVTRNNSRVVG